MQLTGELDEGFGTAFAVARSGALWATATTNQVYIWRGEQVVHSVRVSGYVGGRPAFDAEEVTLTVGGWSIDIATGDATWQFDDPDWLVEGIEDAPESDRFGTPFVARVPGTDLAVVRSEFRLDRSRGSKERYSGPRSQLLLADLDEGHLVAVLLDDAFRLSNAVDASTDYVVAAKGREVSTWWSDSGEEIATWEAGDIVDAIAVNQVDGRIAVLSQDGRIDVHDPDGMRRASWAAHGGHGGAVAWGDGPESLASASADGHVCVWKIDDIDAPQPELASEAHLESTAGLTFGWEDRWLLVAGTVNDRKITIFDLAAGSG